MADLEEDNVESTERTLTTRELDGTRPEIQNARGSHEEVLPQAVESFEELPKPGKPVAVTAGNELGPRNDFTEEFVETPGQATEEDIVESQEGAIEEKKDAEVSGDDVANVPEDVSAEELNDEIKVSESSRCQVNNEDNLAEETSLPVVENEQSAEAVESEKPFEEKAEAEIERAAADDIENLPVKEKVEQANETSNVDTNSQVQQNGEDNAAELTKDSEPVKKREDSEAVSKATKNTEGTQVTLRSTNFNTFISTTESMRNAARTKVDTIIAHVQQSFKPGDKQDSVKSEKERITLESMFVDALCDSIVGGNFDLELNYDIRDPVDILAMFDLFDRVSTNTKFQILVVLHAVLKKSVENLLTCTKAGLISKLLDRISSAQDEVIADKMIELVGVLATYSITIKELKYFLASLQMTDDSKWPRHAFKLLGILKRMPEKHGPDVYFDFSGKSGSGIVLPPIIRWPHQPGFSFATWLQLDAAHLSSVEQNMKPHIYSLMTNKGIGYSAHFSGPMLVLEVHGKGNKVFTILVKFEFRPQIWYHVCVSHTYNRFKSSEIRCFVNGVMVTTGEINIPTSKEVMDKCFIGLGQAAGKAADHKCSFKGQMAAVYLFGDSLHQSATAAIYRLGPGYKGKFKFESELDIPLYEMDRKTLFDGKLAASIVFTYNPKAVEGQMCLESSPNDNKIFFMHTSRAIMLEGVQSVVTQSLQAALQSLGGIQMLYPLFTQLDCPFYDQDKPEEKLCKLLLSLVYDLLRGSAMCQQQFLQSQGFMIIGHVLEKSSECHLTEEVVDILLGLARYLMSTPSASGLLGSLLDHILLNPALWIKTPLTLQANLLSLFATGYVGGLDYAGYIRREVGVPRLMLMLRKYYSLDSSSANPATVGSTKEEIISLRAFMLLLIKQMIIKLLAVALSVNAVLTEKNGDGIQDDELRSILVYLTIEEKEDNLIDVLQLLLATLCEMSEKIIVCFDNLEAFRILFLKLLISENETVRVYCLKIIASYIKYLTLQRKMELVVKYGFITMIGEKLLPFELTSLTYNALFEILSARVTKHIITGRHAEPDSTITVYHPTILPVIVKLILWHGRQKPKLEVADQPSSTATTNGTQTTEDKHEITRVFLSDLVLLLNHSKDNRRLMLQLMCWQHWLFALAYFDPQTKDEAKITDTVFTIVRMLLHYAIQYEKEGWRVWVDTLAILHGKISEYNTKQERLAKGQEPEKMPMDTFEISTLYKDKAVDLETGEAKSEPQVSKLKPKSGERKSADTEAKVDSNGVETKPSNTAQLGNSVVSNETQDGIRDQVIDGGGRKEGKANAAMDVRMKFFYSILQSGGQTGSAAVLRGNQDSPDSMKRSQSENNLDQSTEITSETTDAKEQERIEGDPSLPVRPRSASPTVGTKGEDDLLRGNEQIVSSGDDSQSGKKTREVDSTSAVSKGTLDDDYTSDAASNPSVTSGKVLERHRSDDHIADEKSSKKIPPPQKSKSLDFDIGQDSSMKTTFIGAQPADEEEKKESSGDVAGAEATEEGPNTPSGKCRPYIDVPEFSWSPLHQRLLTELLFAVESDIQVWKTHTRKTINDFIGSRESQVYIGNLCHMVSILSDSLIFCCGGLLPLLSSATSRNFASDVLEACGGMTLDASFSFLNRIMDLVDIIAFASTVSFSSVESHRNMSAGGVLRQCVRLVFCSAARNRVVCRQREPLHWSSTGPRQLAPKNIKETEDAIKTLIASTKPATNEDVVQNIPGHVTTITHPERLLQDTDLNRLRAIVYREVEDSRQSQYIALVVVYYVAVLMVARYRDILENETDDLAPRRSYSTSEGVGSGDHRRRAATWSGTGNQPLSSAFKPAGERVEEESSESTAEGATAQANTQVNEPPRLTLEQRIDMAFKSSCTLLKEILFDFAHYLSRILVGSRGQDLLSDGLSSLKSEDSTVELVMLLCSQEWQNSLQKHAGAAFVDLINEGRLISHATRERIVITASEARDIMKEKNEFDNMRHMQFQEICTKTEALYHNENKTYDEFFRAKRRRNSAMAEKLLEKTFDILTSEFGAWPLPERANFHVFHKLDYWEDNLRRRMRLVKNPIGTTHPEAILEPIAEEDLPKIKSNPNLKYHLYRQKTLDQTSNGSTSEEETEEGEVDVGDLTKDEIESKEERQIEILHTTKCQVIAPGVVVGGTLAVATSFLYFTADEEEIALKKIDPAVMSYTDCLNVKCAFSEITAVCSRRYLLQNKALEIFLSSRRSFMFAFNSHEIVKKVVQYLPPVGIGPNYGLPRARYISLASPKQLFAKSNMTQRWQMKEVSNFEYLMFLNTIAGRTMNDLNQYIVFPWILSDYDSESIDLQNDASFRDLSKPIGAINPYRLGQFVERFNTWDRNDDIPPFHYGTHYSTAGFVLNWMVRVEPFTTLFLNLQNGKFDHPNRTFSGIKRAWENCQRDTSDVKELIPELFYLPEILTNDNEYILGDDEEGKAISNVKLPAWAKTPEDFIRIHREALESEYVSNNLHRWIDLIFGFKQRGVEAEHAANVFYYLTYEGSVDLDSITDTVTKEAIEQQIRSFGQTPSQLLINPHPPKDLLEKQSTEEKEPHRSIFLTFVATPDVPIAHIAANVMQRNGNPAIVTISTDQMFSVNRWINNGGAITSFQALRNVQIEQDPIIETTQARLKRFLGEPLDESVTVSSQCFCVTVDNRFILACGYWDKSFKTFSTDSGKLSQCIFGHLDVVTCLAYSDDNMTGSTAIIVSGSRDATVLVWLWDQKKHRVVVPNVPSSNGTAPLSICTGHEFPIVCVDVNTSLGIVASGSLEGPCLLHSTNGELLRSLRTPAGSLHPLLVKISNDRYVTINYSPNDRSQLATFTINGRFLKEVGIDDDVGDMAMTQDGCYFVSGGTNRCFQVWRTFDLALMSVYPPCEGEIRSLVLTPDQKCLVAGISNGAIIAIAMDFSMWPRQ